MTRAPSGRPKDTRKGKKRSERRGPPLTDRERERQRLFVTLYCHPDYARNGTRAAFDAGYSKKAPHVQASRLLDMPHIRDEINAELARQVDRAQIDSARVVKEWGALGTVNIRDILEIRTIREGKSIKRELFLKADSLDHLHPSVTAAIREVEVTKDGIKVRLYDKHPALTGLAKHFQMFTKPLDPARRVYSMEERLELIIGLFQVLAKRKQESQALPAGAKVG